MGKITKAILSGLDVNMIKKLILEGEDIEETDKDRRTPLIHAVIDNRFDLAEILLESGANVNAQDSNGYSPLHYAAQNYYIELAELLIGKNAQIDPQDNYGNTPLFKAVFNSKGRGDVIKLLIEHGADKDIANNYEISSFQLANSIANYNITHFMQ